MKMIKLSPSKYGQFYTLVDDEDYLELSKYKWHVRNNYNRGFYVGRCFNNPNNWRKVETIIMHRQIMNFPKLYIDHINKNGLDNQKSNLRLCTSGENRKNSKLNKNNTSGHRNIYWSKDKEKWRAVITGKHIHLGYFKEIQDAVEIVKKKSQELYGDFYDEKMDSNSI